MLTTFLTCSQFPLIPFWTQIERMNLYDVIMKWVYIGVIPQTELTPWVEIRMLG